MTLPTTPLSSRSTRSFPSISSLNRSPSPFTDRSTSSSADDLQSLHSTDRSPSPLGAAVFIPTSPNRISEHQDIRLSWSGNACCNKIFSFLKKNNINLTFLTVNAVRDFVWTYLTANNENMELRYSSEFRSQVEAQCLYSFVACLATGVVCYTFSEIGRILNLTPEDFTRVKNFMACFIASLSLGSSVFVWDEAQRDSANLFASVFGEKVTSVKPQCLSAIGAALAESPFQAIVSVLLMATLCKGNAQVQEATEFKNYTLSDYLKKIGCGALSGIIPSATWQLAFVAAATMGCSPIEAATLVTGVTLMANLFGSMLEGNLSNRCVGNRQPDSTLAQSYEEPFNPRSIEEV